MQREQRRYQAVLEQIQRSIESGTYPAGGRLPPERELAERFQVSRPTIREAIIALEALNRVQVKTGSGVYVLESPEQDPGFDDTVSAFELTEARALIEGEAAALAATMITDDQLADLETALYDMADESAEGQLLSETADRRFHRLIAEATRNQVITATVKRLWDIRDSAQAIHAAYQAICEIDGQVRVGEHREIYDALRRRDAAASRTAMHSHFTRILNKLIAAIEAEQVAKVRRDSEEWRARYALNHLESGSRPS